MPSIWAANMLTGGASGALDAIDGNLLTDGDGAVVIEGTTAYFYSLYEESSADAESSPDIISPDANPGEKRWILQSVGGGSKGLDAKNSVRVATGINIDLTSGADPNPIDGVTLLDGDRILLKSQTTLSENGIYVANVATSPDTWTRAEDFDEDSDVTSCAFVYVEEGDINGNEGFILTTNNPITVGSTNLTFSKMNTHTDISKDGTTVLSNVNDINFTSSGDIAISIDDDGDGSATINISSTVPSGIITMWSGAQANIPTGWVLCDGTNSTPDLRNRFIIGAGKNYAVADTGDGSIPEHNHGEGDLTPTAVNGDHSNHILSLNFITVDVNEDGTTDTVVSVGGTVTDGDHNHTLSGSTANYGSGTEVIAKYYALCYIMKT